ncbi:PREDICTED: protein trichome birefringence-like 35 [Camelina sativa]|uniref:Protein trichome birefringence-like 35 n=1 Tax=Camelina sativa TaxID=90675 RepID=A0ABM1RFF7_CAMSA|nr:PREDICTED: protein trichome birefringence-like 35 [Camelina sativa]XP_019097745.1 PREDICTED: protein trichome birefringence-like 35 [Camelina sativa]
MSQRWSSRKKSRLPLAGLLFMLVVTVMILFNERTIHQIHFHAATSHSQILPQASSTFNFVKPNLPANINLGAPLEVLDRFSRCNSTKKYSEKNIRLVDPYEEEEEEEDSSGHHGPKEDQCDVFSGKWVFDNSSYPLHKESDCPYMSDQLACQKHGRKDLDYQHWRWQPHSCNLNRWNVTDMWEKLRGKRLMFVGDSLNRGQWISMVCLLQSVIPRDKQSMSPNAHLTIFRAEDYNATVEFLWAPLLVESNSDDPVNHRLDERIIRPDSVLKHASKWQHADILIFNTYLWWRQDPVKIRWSSEEKGSCEEVKGAEGMEMAMNAWADWIANNVDPKKKRVFFVTMSPTHQWSREWNPGSEGNCYGEKKPIEEESYWGSGSDIQTMRMVKRVLERLGPKVSVINITQLSEYRKDGHPSVYRKFWEPLTKDRLNKPASYSDCTHWCVPGVPDVWNQLLYHFL